METEKYQQIRNLLIQYAYNIKDDYEAPWLDEKPLSMKNANKYFLWAIINYRVKHETAWDPKDNVRKFVEGYLSDPFSLWDSLVKNYTEAEWASKKKEFHLHYLSAAHDRIWRIGNDIVNFYDGDTRMIWDGKNSYEVSITLEKMRCGRKITDMIVGHLKNYGLIMGKGDIAADTHVCTVLGRIFFANPDLQPDSARQLGRKICPNDPWEIDLALYDIGKYYCLPDDCHYADCPIGKADLCEDYAQYKNTTWNLK
jgi:hypothetical protein